MQQGRKFLADIRIVPIIQVQNNPNGGSIQNPASKSRFLPSEGIIAVKLLSN
jgi:hypothetical protein